MPYPRRLINEGEEVILDLRPHWWYFSRHVLTGIPLVIALILVFQTNGDVRTVLGWLWSALALSWAVWLGLRFLEWRFTYFVLTSRRVIERSGVLAKRGREIPLNRINNINFSQTIVEKAIGAGTLIIESAGEQGQAPFRFVRHPDEVQQEIYVQIEANAQREAQWHRSPAAEGPAAPAPSIPDQIEQLARLRDQGHISPAEFEAKKSELLGRM